MAENGIIKNFSIRTDRTRKRVYTKSDCSTICSIVVQQSAECSTVVALWILITHGLNCLHFICILYMHYSTENPNCSIFRTSTVIK